MRNFAPKRNHIALLCILTSIVVNLIMPVGQAQQRESVELKSATVLPQPRDISSFKLMDAKNKTFTNKNFTGHWTMLFFGFTHCRVVCPKALATLNEVYTKLQQNKQQSLPQVVFVSIDPERDSLTRVGQFVTAFNPDFQGVTGNRAQVDKMMQEFGAVAVRINKPYAEGGVAAKDNYQIEHSSSILLVDPNGKFYAVFAAPHNATNIAQDMKSIMNHASVS